MEWRLAALSLLDLFEGSCVDSHSIRPPLGHDSRGVTFQIFRFAEAILRDKSYDLESRFCGRRTSLDKWSGKIKQRIGTRLSALHSTFHF